jgi:hypothetical protein
MSYSGARVLLSGGLFRIVGLFSGNRPVHAKSSGTFRILPEKCPAKKFDQKKSGLSRFRAKNFPPREHSTGFFSTFEPEKIPVKTDSGRSLPGRVTTEK